MTKSAHRHTATEPHIWSSVVRGLQLPLEEHNIDYLQLLDVCEIHEADLQQVRGKVPLKKYLRFIEIAAEWSGDPLLGARLARSAGPETLGAIGFLFLSSPTLADALSDSCRFMNLLQGATHVKLSRDGETVSWSYQLYEVADVDSRQDVEFSLALTCRMIRMFCGAEVIMPAVCFRHSRSALAFEYERLFKTETRFNQESNCILIARKSMRLPGKLFDSSLSGVLKDFLNAELKRKECIHSFADQVRHVLLEGGIGPPITAAKTAFYLGVSKATLYRKLKAENLTYGRLLGDVSFEIARNYLSASELSVTQIAHIVGFAESASFSRAFSRWSGGTTPSRYRREGILVTS